MLIAMNRLLMDRVRHFRMRSVPLAPFVRQYFVIFEMHGQVKHNLTRNAAFYAAF
jgi:hypothetical protein